MEIEINTPIIEDFLYIMDPAAEGEGLGDYSDMIVSSLIASGDADVEPEEPMTADTPLPAFCKY